MTDKECAEILKKQCEYATIHNPFYPLNVDASSLWEAIHRSIEVLEKTSCVDTSRGLPDHCYFDPSYTIDKDGNVRIQEISLCWKRGD